jgi:hypothetical protein
MHVVKHFISLGPIGRAGRLMTAVCKEHMPAGPAGASEAARFTNSLRRKQRSSSTLVYTGVYSNL